MGVNTDTADGTIRNQRYRPYWVILQFLFPAVARPAAAPTSTLSLSLTPSG